MKRIIVIAFVIMALATAASAQESSKYLGIKGGLNMFKLYGDDVEDAKSLYSFAIGGFITCNFNEMFALQPEIYYSIKGAREETVAGDIDLKLGYIDIPILLKVKLPKEGKSWSPNLYAGPYFAFLLSADLEGFDVKDDTKSTDIGLVVGAGIDFMLSEGMRALNLDFRYSVGFTKLDDAGDAEVFNNGFQFLVGYGFSL